MNLKQAIEALEANGFDIETQVEYTDHIKHVCSPRILEAATTIVDYFSLDISNRILLSAFMITKNMDDIFFVQDELSTDLIEKAHKFLVDLLDIFRIYKRTGNICYTVHGSDIRITSLRYNESYQRWKEVDVCRLSNYINESRNELNTVKQMIAGSTIQEVEDVWMDSINETNQTLDKLQDVLVDATHQPFQVPASVPLKIPGSNEQDFVLSLEQVKEVAERAYWDTFEEELEKRNYSKIIKLLEEVRERFKTLISSKDSLIQEINENIDVGFIKQQIEHNVIQDGTIVAIMLYIIDFLEKLQMPADDYVTKEWKEALNNQFTSQDKYSIIIPGFFKRVFSHLDKIETDIIDFYMSRMREK